MDFVVLTAIYGCGVQLLEIIYSQFVLNVSYTNALTFSTELKGFFCLAQSCCTFKCLQDMHKTTLETLNWYTRKKETVLSVINT